MTAAQVFLTAFSAISGDFSFSPLWSTNTGTFLESSASLADIDRDGVEEILVAGREEMIALSGKGEELWRWRTRGRFMTYPAIFSTRDSGVYIYAADFSGLLSCLDGKGELLWFADLDAASSWSSSVIADLDSDGHFEVIQTDESGSVWAFDALNGTAKWKSKIEGKPVSPAAGDLDSDGESEIVVATSAGMLGAFDARGNSLWVKRIGGVSETWGTSAPVLVQDSEGRGRIAVGTSDERVLCLDAQGRTLWDRPTRGAVASSLSVGDPDSNGQADLFLITQTGVIHRFDEAGNTLWEIDMQGRTLGAGALIDLDGSGGLEYVLSTQEGRLLVLDADGNIRFSYYFKTRTINATPVFGELDPGAPGLEMAIAGGESGNVFCLSSATPPNARAHWNGYRGNREKTGAWFGIIAGEATLRMRLANPLLQNHTSDQPVRFVIENLSPGQSALRAEAVCVGPDGARRASTGTIVGNKGFLDLPVEFVSPGVYRFEWRLREESGARLFSASREVFFQPFANDRAMVRGVIESLVEASDRADANLPLAAQALSREARLLEISLRRVEEVQDLSQGNPDRREEALIRTREVLAQASRLGRISESIRNAAGRGERANLLIFEGDTWESRPVGHAIPPDADSKLSIRRRVVPGEHEPVSLQFLNITDRELTVRVQIDPDSEGLQCAALRSIAVPTSLGEVSYDPLPELDESMTVAVPSLSTQEVWLDFDIGDAQPGTHTVEIRFQSLTGEGLVGGPRNPHSAPPLESKVRIELETLPFEMASPKALRLCMWGTLNKPVIEDLLEHGGNVFVVPHGTPVRDSDQNLIDVDYTSLDALLRHLKGRDAMLLPSGIPSSPYLVGTDEYEADLRAYLKDFVAHLAEWGFDLDDFALYPYDEPGGHGWEWVHKLVEFGKVVKKINPDILMYVDGGGEREMFEAMAPVIDVWVPAIWMLREDSPEMRVIRADGGALWSYDCGYILSRPVGANLKNTSLIPQYRTAALFAFRHHATGIGYWSYNHGEDPWGRTSHEYPVVYEGRTKPVTSRRWEAVREGVEDFRILTALRDRMEGDTGLTDGTRRNIEHLLQTSLPALVDTATELAGMGMGRETIEASLDEEKLRAFRDEMLDCVQAVGGASRASE